MQVAWSPLIPAKVGGVARPFAILAVGCKAGVVWLWRLSFPAIYTAQLQSTLEARPVLALVSWFL